MCRFLSSSLEEQLSIISLFESTIRYIGGLLSAYELSGKQHRSLVTKAAQLADKLIYAWVGVRSCFYFSSPMPMEMFRKMIYHLGNLISTTTCLSIKMSAGVFHYCSSQPDITCALVQYCWSRERKSCSATNSSFWSASSYFSSGQLWVNIQEITSISSLLLSRCIALLPMWVSLSPISLHWCLAKQPSPLPGWFLNISSHGIKLIGPSGLPAQGIDPNTGAPVGGYIVSCPPFTV